MPSFLFSQLSFAAVLLLFFAGTRLDAKSIIVDDADMSHITYSSGWNIGSNCADCFAKPDPSQPFDGTWHDGTSSDAFTPFFTFTFTGKSVEARYTAIDIIQTNRSFITGTNVTYAIDGVQRGTSVRNPADRGAYVYNQTLFNIAGLTNAKHTLRVDLLKPSVLLLDYLVYDDGSVVTSATSTSSNSASSTSSSVSSTPDGTSSTPGPNINVGAITGGAVAAVVVLVLGVVVIWYLKHRSREASRRGRISILGSEGYSPPPGVQPDRRTLMAANTQGLPSSHYYAPSASLTSSTVSPSSSATNNPSGVPSGAGAGAPQGARVNEKSPLGMPRNAVQSPNTAGPPPSSLDSTVVVNDVQPVEEWMVSRQTSMRSALPPYSPRGYQHNDHAPPLPGQ